jgi:hypothetical protein
VLVERSNELRAEERLQPVSTAKQTLSRDAIILPALQSLREVLVASFYQHMEVVSPFPPASAFCPKDFGTERLDKHTLQVTSLTPKTPFSAKTQSLVDPCET